MILNVEHITIEKNYWDKVNILAKEAFPPEEYLDPIELVKMSKDKDFDYLALLDDKTFVGYMAIQIYKDLVYLFFLAIDPQYRGKSYGSKAIETMKQVYPNKTYVVDLEKLDESASNNDQRLKRRSFYLKNGYKETGLYLSYLNVDYEVLYIGNSFNPELFKELMRNIKVREFNPKYFTK